MGKTLRQGERDCSVTTKTNLWKTHCTRGFSLEDQVKAIRQVAWQSQGYRCNGRLPGVGRVLLITGQTLVVDVDIPLFKSLSESGEYNGTHEILR